MMLDEEGFSDVNDLGLLTEINTAAYHGADIRPAWIGGRRPRTGNGDYKGLEMWAGAHYDYYLTFVREYVEQRGAVLDIGCGAGQAVAMLARYADSVVGVDSDAAVVDFACKFNLPENVRYLQASFPEGLGPALRFNYIFCVETLEHIAYDQQEAFMAAALGLLHDGGLMFITTPNEQTPSAPHVGVWSREVVAQRAARFADRIVRRGYFSNTQPGAGWVENGTHHAWVMG